MEGKKREVFKSRYLWFPAPCLSATRRRDACHACLCGRRYIRYIRRHPTICIAATENKALNFLTRATRAPSYGLHKSVPGSNLSLPWLVISTIPAIYLIIHALWTAMTITLRIYDPIRIIFETRPHDFEQIFLFKPRCNFLHLNKNKNPPSWISKSWLKKYIHNL